MDALKALSRQHLRQIWHMAQLGQPLEGEEAALAAAMRLHPEDAGLWERLDELTDEQIEQDGTNPIVHVQMHVIVENQIAENNPAEVRKTLEHLLPRYSRHEAVHLIAGVLAEEIYAVLKKRRPFNDARYLRKLRNLAR